MYYAWIEDLYEVSVIDFNIYDVFIHAALRGVKVSYSPYYKDYMAYRWNI